MARYRNSFHRPGYQTEYGPEFFETDARPAAYRGLLIYRRLRDCFDIVSDGVCIGMCAGPNGARRWIDARLGASSEAA